jgi:SPP1 gp7 family putative phage head morphogenesis protein
LEKACWFFRQSPKGEDVTTLGLTATQISIAKLYGAECCDHSHSTIKLASEISSPIIEDFLFAIYKARLGGQKLHAGLYNQTADKLMAAVMQKFTGDFSYASAQNALSQYIRRNIFAFSAAKNFSQQKDLSMLVTDGTGKIKSFSQFRKDAAKVVDDYNKNWLEAEYNNTIASAQMAVKWNDFVDSMDETPYLEYSTVGDERVRASHAALDGLTLKVDSPVWNTMYPPNDWNCRCTVIPGSPSKASDGNEAGKKAKATVNGYFDNHVGKTGVVFKESAHPYFKNIKGKVDELDAVKNYDLKTPDPIRQPQLKKATTAEAANWWQRIKADNGVGANNIALKDVHGNEVLIQGDLFTKNKQLMNLPDVLRKPDEVFSRYEGEKLSTVYVKYYQETPVMLITHNDKKNVRAVKMFTANEKAAAFRKHRKGVLVYKK